MTAFDRDHRADVIDALGEWNDCFDVDAITTAATRAGGVGRIDTLEWQALLREHTISGPLFNLTRTGEPA